MTYILISFFAYFIDKFIGEFKFIRHPIIFIGDLINFFEKYFYKASILRGFFLIVFVLFIVSFVSFVVENFLYSLGLFWYIFFTSIFSSMFLAHKMLYDVVQEILLTKDKKSALSMLVSRDTENLNESEIYKAAIETYAENLSDGVIAPLFYLLFFSLPGIVVYKAVNTMDSMVGYRNERYEKFGKCAAYLDDVLNYIPSRLTALLLMFLAKKKRVLLFYHFGKLHKSPNAGHPISAMALFLGVKLGGDTSYFGKLEKKPYFGLGRKIITQNDLKKALAMRYKIDFFIFYFFIFLMVLFYFYGY